MIIPKKNDLAAPRQPMAPGPHGPAPGPLGYREDGAPVHIYLDSGPAPGPLGYRGGASPHFAFTGIVGWGNYKSAPSKSTFTRYSGMGIISINSHIGV